MSNLLKALTMEVKPLGVKHLLHDALDSKEKLVNHLALNKVMFVGRSLFPEYVKMFGLNLDSLQGKTILDVASGPASFTREMRDLGYDVTALDRAYVHSAKTLSKRANKILQKFFNKLQKDSFDSLNGESCAWLDSDVLEEINTPTKLLKARKRSLQLFTEDFQLDPNRVKKSYVAGSLPKVIALKNRTFDLILVGNLLFAYSKKKNYDYKFHIESIKALALHLSPRGEIRIYPYGESDTFDFPLERLRSDLLNLGICSGVRESEYRFVKGWTHTLVLWRD